MRIGLVGPTHPFKGGVAAHTTQTAHELVGAGHDVTLVSWNRLYPGFLYPGEQAVPDGRPDLPPFDPVERTLSWNSPPSWWRTGTSLRAFDLVAMVCVVPFHVPALLALAASARRTSLPGGRLIVPLQPPRIAAIVHNVAPHETHPGGQALMRRLARSVDGVLVHSADQADSARALRARSVRWAPLPPHLPGGLPERSGRSAALARPPHLDGEPVRLLALGIVRDYKGFDLLLEAVRDVPGVRVTVAGEFWGEPGEKLHALAADAGLAGRVELRPGYVAGEDVPGLLAAHDVLALPYRHATASQNVLLGHAHGLPVLASRAGTFGDDVRDGVDGLLVRPGDQVALAGALRELTVPGRLDALRAGIPDVDVHAPWKTYLDELLAVTR